MKQNKRAIAFKMFSENKTRDDVSLALGINKSGAAYYHKLWREQDNAPKPKAQSPKPKTNACVYCRGDA